MSTGLTPVYGVDGSDRTTPGYQGAMTREAEDFGRQVNGEASPDNDNDDDENEYGLPSAAEVLSRAQDAHRQAQTFYDANLSAGWERTYKAFRNQHFTGSKYLSDEFRGRSKVFQPKTRSAVRKQLTSAAHALFASADVMNIQAQDESNPQQRASAAIKQELLSYRLSRKSRRNGINWFLTALGAREDSTLSGICISKQAWRFRENRKGTVLEDRPEVQLFPPENVLIDPNADWIDPAQTAGYLILKHSMTAEDALSMMKNNSVTKWRPATKESLNAAGRDATHGSAAATRSARTGGSDAKTDAHGVWQQIWLHEVFMRIEGSEFVFWMLGDRQILSDPLPVEDAYPHMGGYRPVVVGYGALESHKVFPLSPAESWQPLQMEANDQANLRLDHMKMKVDPPTLVKRGQKVDLQQVQRKGPGSVILVQDLTDLEPYAIPDVPQSAYVESNYLNAAFDDLAGNFNSGSVQTNRSLNETVGGMKLLSADANSVGEFDLAVFVETYIEPVLWQILKLEEFFETDATLLVIAGKKAGLLEKHGVNEITDKMLMAETSLTVNVGVGSASTPQEKANRIIMAAKGVGEIIAPLVQAGVVKPPIPKVGEIIDAVFGGAGVQDARERFFQTIDDDEPPPQPPQGPPPDPAAEAKAAALQQKMQQDAALGQQRMQQAQQTHGLKMAEGQQKLALTAAQTQQKIEHGERQASMQEHAARQGQQFAGQTHAEKIAAMRQQRELAGQPEGEDGYEPEPQEAPEPEAAPNAAMMQMMQQLMQRVEQMGAQIEDMTEAAHAPAELIRDPRTGQAVAVNKGGQIHPVERDAQGRPTRLGPAIQQSQGA